MGGDQLRERLLHGLERANLRLDVFNFYLRALTDVLAAGLGLCPKREGSRISLREKPSSCAPLMKRTRRTVSSEYSR